MPKVTKEERELRLAALEGRTIPEAVKVYEAMSGRTIKRNSLQGWAAYNGIKHKPARRYQPWTTNEVRILRELFPRNSNMRVIRELEKLGKVRSDSAIRSKAHDLGIWKEGRA